MLSSAPQSAFRTPQSAREPTTESNRLVPGDAHHRVVGQVKDAAISLRFGALAPPLQTGLGPPAVVAIALGIVHERLELFVGDGVARDEIVVGQGLSLTGL